MNQHQNNFTIAEIKSLSEESIIDNIKAYLNAKIGCKSFSEGQLVSWQKSIQLLKSIFRKENRHWNIIFEFVIPLSSGKRPDIILINGTNIFVIEVKNKSNYTIADLDQIKSYALDLKLYHSVAKNFDVIPVLLLLTDKHIITYENGIDILSSNNLKELLLKKNKDYLFIHPINLNEGTFKPVLNIMEYAKCIYNKTTIQNIEQLCFENANIVSAELEEIFNTSKEQNQKSIVFITGTAGSGKSALGLKCAFNNDGLYVTKNRQFKDNLTTQLQTESHIKTSHNFNTEYANKSSTPHWDVVVFDEAQRFISSAKMKDYFGVNISEHEFIMDVFSSKKHCMLIILIGEHQEIGWGETSDTYVWNQVFEKRKDKWTVYGSEILIKEFDERNDIEFIAKDCLDLKVSFRQIKTPEYPVFVNKLLDYKGDFQTEEFKALKQTYASISENGFEFFITRNLDKAIEYCENRYNNQPNSYCTFSSSESDYDWNELEQDVESIIVNDYNISSKFKINEHFKNNGNNSSKEAVFYPLTEYSAIGFEIQLPILVWGLDYIWYENKWNYSFIRRVLGNTEFRQNAYRILLTRGKEGVILYFPPVWKFNKTFELFKELGAKSITN